MSKEVVRGQCPQKCLILSGAGSGHEPLAHGFVGPGGIAASIAGEVFASPSTGQVIETIRLLAGKIMTMKCLLSLTITPVTA